MFRRRSRHDSDLRGRRELSRTFVRVCRGKRTGPGVLPRTGPGVVNQMLPLLVGEDDAPALKGTEGINSNGSAVGEDGFGLVASAPFRPRTSAGSGLDLKNGARCS